ncbi:hypothetical protein ED733_005177 [Metarhizium rileyi]|uniref:Uncharacterized protein n=1 Tax=Metarhizium rileyi (strain RCEF 4871) TaxID=1649241 RepID=A0A5C6GNP3_METRR|nr:hypothetical protein ED733_005177 [Metarhizium rileyi]
MVHMSAAMALSGLVVVASASTSLLVEYGYNSRCLASSSEDGQLQPPCLATQNFHRECATAWKQDMEGYQRCICQSTLRQEWQGCYDCQVFNNGMPQDTAGYWMSIVEATFSKFCAAEIPTGSWTEYFKIEETRKGAEPETPLVPDRNEHLTEEQRREVSRYYKGTEPQSVGPLPEECEDESVTPGTPEPAKIIYGMAERWLYRWVVCMPADAAAPPATPAIEQAKPVKPSSVPTNKTSTVKEATPVKEVAPVVNNITNITNIILMKTCQKCVYVPVKEENAVLPKMVCGDLIEVPGTKKEIPVAEKPADAPVVRPELIKPPVAEEKKKDVVVPPQAIEDCEKNVVKIPEVYVTQCAICEAPSAPAPAPAPAPKAHTPVPDHHPAPAAPAAKGSPGAPAAPAPKAAAPAEGAPAPKAPAPAAPAPKAAAPAEGAPAVVRPQPNHTPEGAVRKPKNGTSPVVPKSGASAGNVPVSMAAIFIGAMALFI